MRETARVPVTEAETQTLNGLARGLSRKEVAEELAKSVKTVDAQVLSARDRFHAATTFELAYLWGLQRGRPGSGRP